MEDFEAIGIAEGFIPCESEEKTLEAWQHLHDTGLGYKLQGWFGRMLNDLTKWGLIKTEKK